MVQRGFHDGRVTARSCIFYRITRLSNVIFKLPKQWDQRPPLIAMKSKLVIGTCIKWIIPTSGMIASRVLGVLKLMLRCTVATATITLTLAPRHIVIKAAVQACTTVLVTMSTLGPYDATKNTLTWKVRVGPEAPILRWTAIATTRAYARVRSCAMPVPCVVSALPGA